MTFNPIHVYPDPLTEGVFLGLVWGLVAIAVVIRRSTEDFRFKRHLLIVIAVLSIGAATLTIRSFGFLIDHRHVAVLGAFWFVVTGLLALAALVTFRLARNNRSGGR